MSVYYFFILCLTLLANIQAMSSNSKDYFDPTLCEYPVEDDDYQPVINNQSTFVVNFTRASFFSSSTSTDSSSSIDEVDNHMGEMSLESLQITYGIPSSISLERAKQRKA